MLYLSRRLDYIHYGVVDTDDDTEDKCTSSELNDAVTYGMKIEGVYRDSENTGRYWPWQDHRYVIPLQAKTKTLLGVDIHRYKNEISFIMANPKVTKSGTRIRLSDYGDAMNWSCPVGFYPIDWEKILILVLDDKMTMLGKTVKTYRGSARLDVTEVENEDLVKQIYQSMIQTHLRTNQFTKYLIDRPERMEEWQRYYKKITGY